MTPPEQHPTPEQMREVTRIMQIRMRNYALHHFARIGARSLTALKNLDLFEDEVEPIGANVDMDVLRDRNHSRRVALPPGPLLLYVSEAENSKRTIVELPVLLFSELRDVRDAALAELLRMIEERKLRVTPKTQGVFEGSEAGLLSEVPHEWRSAALAVTDALYDDVFVALQGVHQSLECDPVLQDSLNAYVPRVIHPSVSSLDSIVLPVSKPMAEHSRLTQIITTAVDEAESLVQACERYYVQLGYLPLAARYGMAALVSRWVGAHPDTGVWREVWQWADGASGPIPKYHACSVFAVRPDLVSEGELVHLWSKILDVLRNADSRSADNIDHAPWGLRRDLAQHFTHHLEGHLPDSDGANITCFAWWFSEQVASIFPDEAKSAQFYRKNWFSQASEQSTHIWLAALPRIGTCFLRYLTTTVPSPWGTALLAVMGPKFEELAVHKQPEETQKRFHEALVSCMLGALPVVVESPPDPTYAQECSLGDTALKWAAHAPEEQGNALRQLLATSRTLGSTEGLCNALRKLGDSPLADQVAVTLALKARAYTDPTIAPGVWEILSDPGWRKSVLGSVEERVLGLLIEAFSMLQVSAQGQWLWQLPHYIAELCENTDDTDRRRQLFLYVIHTSLASDTVSAVRRLLRGARKTAFTEVTLEYREHVQAMWTAYPPWVQGRLRSLLANLYVV